MKTTFIAIHVTPTGKRLTAPFSLQESHHQAVRAAAERAMRETHGPVHVHGWELVPSVESSAP